MVSKISKIDYLDVLRYFVHDDDTCVIFDIICMRMWPRGDI